LLRRTFIKLTGSAILASQIPLPVLSSPKQPANVQIPLTNEGFSPNDIIKLTVSRDPSNWGDTYVGEAIIDGIDIRYTENENIIVYIPPMSMISATNDGNPPLLDIKEDVPVLCFDEKEAHTIDCNFMLPSNYSGESITVDIPCMYPDNPQTAAGIVWDIDFERIA
jgi:hypothetical protein